MLQCQGLVPRKHSVMAKGYRFGPFPVISNVTGKIYLTFVPLYTQAISMAPADVNTIEPTSCGAGMLSVSIACLKIWGTWTFRTYGDGREVRQAHITS
jgi:hypothetical protein